MKTKLIAIVITFDNKTNIKLLNSWKILKKKFDIKFISSRSPKPHLTLKSGYIKNISPLVEKLKKKKIKKFKLNSQGLGIFANKNPLLYIRWVQSKKLIKLYNYIDKISSVNFINKSKNSEYFQWVAKTSIAFKDFKYENLPKILNNLNEIRLLKNIEVQKIEVMEINKQGEKIIFTNNLT